jgi:hypothetical protein
MVCPVCTRDSDPALVIGPIAICGACGFPCHIDEAGTVTRATLRQIETLTDEEVGRLRAAVAKIRKPR